MQTDHYFTIGTAHAKAGNPCEDFALSGELREDMVFAVVADGCSGAMANTDEGARAISFAFKKSLQAVSGLSQNWFQGDFVWRLLDRFLLNSYTDNFKDRFSTVVGLASTPEYASLFVMGDGAYAIKFDDGRYRLTWFEWEGNAPYYLNYKSIPSLDEQYRAECVAYTQFPLVENWTDFILTGNNDDPIEILNEDHKRFDFVEGERGIVRNFKPTEEGIEAIAVFTDGIMDIAEVEGISAAAEFLSFKTPAGSFVKRRMMRALDQFAKLDQRPRDDLAMACVLFKKEI
jgi:hypothetical protein